MPIPPLKLSAEVRGLIRQMHPDLKRKVRAALTDILRDPACGKALKEELQGYWSLRVGKSRIIYRPEEDGIGVVAIGPRETIYEEAALQILRSREKS